MSKDELKIETWDYDKYYAWEAFDSRSIIAEGVTRTRLGRWWQVFQFKHFYRQAGY